MLDVSIQKKPPAIQIAVSYQVWLIAYDLNSDAIGNRALGIVISQLPITNYQLPTPTNPDDLRPVPQLLVVHHQGFLIPQPSLGLPVVEVV